MPGFDVSARSPPSPPVRSCTGGVVPIALNARIGCSASVRFVLPFRLFGLSQGNHCGDPHGAVLFGRLALAAAAFDPLWLMSSLDMFVMVYMCTHELRTAPLTWLFVSYSGGQAVAWAVGASNRIPRFVSRPLAVPEVETTNEAVVPVRSRQVGLPPHATVAVRVMLAVMAASMAYMLAVM